jgi:uncharacterized protein (TIGR03083 family)
MTDYGKQYGSCRERITALVADLTDDQAGAPVAACPGWSVHDVVAHLVGSVADVLAGRMDGVGSPAWTGAQVDARRAVPVTEMLAEWSATAPQFEDTLRAVGGQMAALGVADAWNHEQDLLGALGRPGSNDPAVELTAVEGYAPMVGGGWSTAGVAPLRVEVGASHVLSAEGDPGATVTGPPYELARAFAGRRTEAQLRALSWTGDPDPYVETLASMGPIEPLAR